MAQQATEHAAEARAASPQAAAAGREAARVCAADSPPPLEVPGVGAAAPGRAAYGGVARAAGRPGLLHLFAGGARDDSLAAAFRRHGWAAAEVDVERGGPRHDLTSDSVFRQLLRRAEAGEWRLLVAGPPCSTFSVARFRQGSGSARPLRRRSAGGTIADLTFEERCKVDEADLLLERTLGIAAAVIRAGGDVVIENPVDRGDPALSDRLAPRSQDGRGVHDEPDHFPMWLVPAVQQFQRVHHAAALHFPMCAFGSDYQKWTTLLCTPAAAALLEPGMRSRRCDHARHGVVAAGYGPNGPLAPAAARYPAGLHDFWAAALAGQDGGLLAAAEPGDGCTACALPTGAPRVAATAPPSRIGDWLAHWREAPALRRAMDESTAAIGQFSMATTLPERPAVVAGMPVESAEADGIETRPRADWRARRGPVREAAPQVEHRRSSLHPLAPVDVGHSGRQPRAGYEPLSPEERRRDSGS